ncbi:tetratricopeptide repeat protein [Weissella diestrammenae]|uniref:Tetratricopeptide repeat protein n=1 Tax=Weissella diestrammenae TaxID=1162633 RepID=A0A7G9T5R9_9LACO|nr:tetratricopeptide repeat protein [Weissella diestrammenae]MCM0582272.1 tetratricopeptide repeat protein [Weissella diestrammenae]QNN75444.1 tetratricopeptide repeat protein [Weissella diestrammenae]
MATTKDLQADLKMLVARINDDAHDWRAYVDLINVLVTSENFVEAEELALKSLTLFKSSTEAQQQLLYTTGNLYYLAGKYELANQFFTQVDDRNLKHDATMMQAQSWFNQKRYQQALAFALTGVEQQPNDEAAQVLLGNIWMSLQSFEQAATQFEQALKVNQDNFDANFGLGVLAAINGERENHGFTMAKQIDAEKFERQTRQLDDLLQVMVGNRNDE